MIDFRPLVVIRGQRPHDGLASVLVVPDGSGQREESLEHADDHATGSAAVVSFEVELSFECFVD
jgi:hypothetical protein